MGRVWNNARPMAINPTLKAMTDLLLAELPALGRELLESIQHALHQDPRAFALQDAWSRRRSRFLLEFESELRPQLVRMRAGDLQARLRGGNSGLGGLSLVDESQALRDVGIAHAVELCQEASRTELFQLGNFFTALHRGPVHGRDLNALRPALFARALADALAGSDLSADGHYALMRAAAPALAAPLARRYQQLVGLLHEAELAPMVSTRLGQERRRSPAVRDSQSGALAGLQARSVAISSRPQRLHAAPSESLLDRLYERMLDDPALAAPVKSQLARLQVAVTRLALEDATLLRDESHPTWRLINAIAAYAGGFADANDERLQEFLRFLEDQTAALVQSPQPSSQQFEYLLRLVDAFIARQARERSAPSEAELATLERERQSGAWLKLLREQLDELARRAGLGPHARRFLHARWSVLIVQAMVREGQDGVLVQRLLHWVDPLIDSLRERADAAARAELRLQLPALVSGIESLLEPLGLDPEQRQALMDALMKLHGRLMVQTAATQAGTADARASELPGETQAAADDAAPDEAAVSRFVEQRESGYASVWAHAQVDRSALPTQPLPLPDSAEAQQQVEARLWLDGLRVGGWFHLFVDSVWCTAQLVWIGSERDLFLFVGQDAGQRHSLTVGALSQLYLNGLAMYLEQEGLVERAIGTLLQDLDDE
jgi:hypothetical protein